MLKLLALDRFTVLLVGMVLLATFFPVSGQAAQYFNTLTTVAIAILFFLHGAKLSREAVIEGILHWKMHLLVFAITFFIFPAIGLLAKPILLPLLGQQLYWGFLFNYQDETLKFLQVFGALYLGYKMFDLTVWLVPKEVAKESK